MFIKLSLKKNLIPKKSLSYILGIFEFRRDQFLHSINCSLHLHLCESQVSHLLANKVFSDWLPHSINFIQIFGKNSNLTNVTGDL